MKNEKSWKKPGKKPLYESGAMKPKIVQLPAHLHKAVKRNGGSPWIRQLIEAAIREQP